MRNVSYAKVGAKGLRFLMVLALLVCTQGTECGSSSSSSGSGGGGSGNQSNPEVNGGNSTGVPPPGSTAALLTLINNARTGGGLTALTNDPIATTVAGDYNTAWAAAAHIPTFSFDVGGDLASKGADVTVGSSSNTAAGFATAQAVYSGLLAENPFMSTTFTHIGISLQQPGTGNYWVIVQY